MSPICAMAAGCRLARDVTSVERSGSVQEHYRTNVLRRQGEQKEIGCRIIGMKGMGIVSATHVADMDDGGMKPPRLMRRGGAPSATLPGRAPGPSAEVLREDPHRAENVNGQVKPYQIRQFMELVERYALNLEKE
jgi:hypothetical protein